MVAMPNSASGSFAHEQPRKQGKNDLPRTLTFQPYDLLKTIGRLTGGHQYQLLRESLGRLQATSIVTNIRVPKGKKQRQFSWIESWTDNVDGETQQSRGMSLTHTFTNTSPFGLTYSMGLRRLRSPRLKNGRSIVSR